MNHCILILGMHRSGTSAYAGALQLLGVEFGEPLMPARAGENDRGFFEQLDIYRVHEELLCALGRPWDDLRPLPSGWLDTPPADRARQRLGELVRSQFAASRLWAMKDPRLCRLLPLWKQVLASLDVCVHFLIVWRDPAEVASSLKNRNGFSIEKTGLLWANHNLEVERETRSYERCFASYHQLLEDPVKVLTNLAASFDIDWPSSAAGSARRLNAFIDQNLHRARADQLVAADLGRSAPLVDSLKQLLATSDSAKSSATAEFDVLEKRYADVIQQLDPMLLEHVSSNSFQIGRLENRIERLERELDERTHWLKVQAGEIDSLANRWKSRGLKKLRRKLRTKIKTGFERCRNWLPQRKSPRGEPNETLQVEGQLLAKLAQVQKLTRPGGANVGKIVLQETNHPVVSVVIPVHNQIAVTLQCLESISASTDRSSYEVIVVDDASTDETCDRLAAIQHLRIVRNQSNLGFVDSINQGVLAARGKFVLLLNNDTIVQEGWLDHLVRTFDDFDKVGLVGGKLLYADGTLQEAGGVIWRDGTGWNVGRGKPCDSPQFNYARDVDYCSAACLMIPRSLLLELGLLDTRYRPGYYEDTDLACRVREAGWRTLYQPLSQVVHLEGASAGTDLTKGMKRFQTVNQRKFYERWESDLARHRSPGLSPELEMERQVSRRALIIDHHLPTPDQDSGSVRMFNLLRVLQSVGFKVTFLPDDLIAVQPYTSTLQGLGIEVLYQPHLKHVKDHLQHAGTLYDFVLLSRVNVASKHIDEVRRCCPNAKIAFDTVDLHFLREMREAQANRDAANGALWQSTMERELAVAQKSDVTLVVSPVEQQLLQQIASDLDIRVLSNIHKLHPCRAEFADRQGLLFIGSFEHPPNVDAVKFLVKEIMPLVWERIPSMKLHIIGSKATEQVRQLGSESVEIAGYVPNVQPYFERCRLSVAPLRFGSGVKGKVNQSLAHGVPCVASPFAAEGMQLEHERDVMIADGPRGLADAIVKVYQDAVLWQRLSRGGLDNIEKHFSFRVAATAVQQLLADMGDSRQQKKLAA